MVPNVKRNRHFAAMMILTVLIILITRGLSLTYQMDLHPDENKFFDAASSLLESLLYGTEYVEEKPYPEGAYLFHLPFQGLRMLTERLLDWQLTPRFWGRVASVFYFTLAVLMGMDLLRRRLGGGKPAVALYALSMCFSLFFLEQSRYGTGDMISLFMLMGILELLGSWCAGGGQALIPLSFFLCGALGAVKYPQLYFTLLPGALWFFTTAHRGKARLFRLAGLLGLTLLGLLLFSPKAIFDWAYFYRVIVREMGAYVSDSVGGGFHNNFAQVALFQLFFSDFPLAFLILWAGAFHARPWRKLRGLQPEQDPAGFLFHWVLPLTVFGFFAYNLFVTTLAMRTFTPYFGLSALYTAWLAPEFFRKTPFRRVCCCILTLFMIGRGCCMVALLSRDTYHARFAASVQELLDRRGEENRLITFRHNYIPHKQILADQPYTQLRIQEFQEQNGGSYRLQPGDLVIVGALEHSSASAYPLPAFHPRATITHDSWEAFKAANADYLVAISTPDWPYYLLGGFFKGGSFTNFTYPCSYLYCCPAEQVDR